MLVMGLVGARSVVIMKASMPVMMVEMMKAVLVDKVVAATVLTVMT